MKLEWCAARARCSHSRPALGLGDVLQRLHRLHAVAPHHDHAERLFVRAHVVVRLVEHQVEELIEAAEDTHDAAVTVQLQPKLLVHVPGIDTGKWGDGVRYGRSGGHAGVGASRVTLGIGADCRPDGWMPSRGGDQRTAMGTGARGLTV